MLNPIACLQQCLCRHMPGHTLRWKWTHAYLAFSETGRQRPPSTARLAVRAWPATLIRPLLSFTPWKPSASFTCQVRLALSSAPCVELGMGPRPFGQPLEAVAALSPCPYCGQEYQAAHHSSTQAGHVFLQGIPGSHTRRPHPGPPGVCARHAAACTCARPCQHLLLPHSAVPAVP